MPIIRRRGRISRAAAASALVVLGACTSKASGAELWRKACEHTRAIGETDLDVESCIAEFAAIPRAVADDFARCGLKLDAPDPEGSGIRACIGESARAFLAKDDQTQAALERHSKAIDSFRREHGAYPNTLADLGTLYDGKDAWGHRLRYQARAPDDGDALYELCSAGRDGEHGTSEDRCHRPFIHFQF